MFNAISGITYTPPVYNPQSDYMQFFNNAISAGYSPEEAREIAKKKVKEKQDKKKEKDRKVEDPNKTNKTKQSIDRRI